MARYGNNSGDNPVSLGECEFVHESDKALKVLYDGDEIWLPKSVIHDDSELFDGSNMTGELIVKQWWAEENGYV